MTDAPRRGWMQALSLLLLVAAAATGSSCVFFNTYYNAEKYFAKAEKARAEAERKAESTGTARNRTQYLTLYDTAVRKASLVLEKYPDSDLIDDAMFIAGRALYWQRDYQYAIRSFSDLEANFPESEYFDRSRLWRGRTLIALGRHDEGRAVLSELVREGSPVGDRAGLRLGELAITLGDPRGANIEYRRTLEAFPDSPLAARLWLRIGDVNTDIGGAARLDSAMVAFGRALKSSPSDSVRYRASLNRGRVQYLQGAPDKALATYQKLLGQGRFRAWEGETRILIGRYHRERGLLTESLAEFEKVRDDFPQTVVSAMALYETGLLYLQEHGLRDRALEYFAEVSLEKRGSRADSLANVMQATCAELDGLVEQIFIADSTAAAILYPVVVSTPDTMAAGPTQGQTDADASALATAAPDTAALNTGLVAVADTAAALPAAVLPAPAPPAAAAPPQLPARLEGYLVAVDSTNQWQPLVARPGWRGADAQAADAERHVRRPPRRPTGDATFEEHLFMLAELYRDRLVLPDSAAVIYEVIADRFPSSKQRSRALYSLAWIHYEQLSNPEAAEPYLRQLVDQYGATAHANAARRLLELPLERTAEEHAADVFREIEQQRSAAPDSPEQWLPRLDALSRDYPQTVTAARAAFLAAWLTENVVQDSIGAEARYDSVASHFPKSRFAELVERRRQSQREGLLARMERELKTLGQRIPTAERLNVIAIEPDSLDSTSRSRKYLGFAMRAHRRERFEEAERLYQSSLDEQLGNNGDAYAGLGDVAWRQGYYEDAIEQLRRALKERSTSLLPQYRLFQYHVQQSQMDSANHYLRNVTRRDRDNPDVLSVIDRFPTVASAEPEPIEVDQLETIVLEPSVDNLRQSNAYFGIVEAPLVRTGSSVKYPDNASDSASVVIDILVNRQGRGDSLRVFRGEEPFASEALRAVGEYRFYAAENRQEEPLNVWVEVVIPFSPPALPASPPSVAEGAPAATQELTE